MNINELLNSRRAALYGDAYDDEQVLENMGDITGEYDWDDIEIDEELLLEALEILDDEYFEMVDEAAAMNKLKSAGKKVGKKYNDVMNSADEKIYKYILKTYKNPKRIKVLIAQCEANIEELQKELKNRDSESKKRKVARIAGKSILTVLFGAAGFVTADSNMYLSSNSHIKKMIKAEKLCIKQAKKRLKELENGNKAKGGKKAVKENYEYIDLYDDDTEFVEESYDNDDELIDESGLFDEDDLKDIMFESMDMKDPEEYIETALHDFSDETLALVGEMYIDELIIEEAVDTCDDYTELETIEEAFKENAKSKVEKAQKTIKDLAKKFAAWIQGLIGSLSTLFVSCEKLVSKYKGKIVEEYNKRGPRIKVKTYKYSHKPEQLKSLIGQFADAYDNYEESKLSAKDAKEKAAQCVRTGEKKDYRVSELGINNILELAGDKKNIIKSLKNVNNEMQKTYKNGIDAVKKEMESADSPMTKEGAKKAIVGIKLVSKCTTAAVNSYISEIKAGNRAYSAIVRKLLNTKKAPNTPDAKGLTRPTE